MLTLCEGKGPTCWLHGYLKHNDDTHRFTQCQAAPNNNDISRLEVSTMINDNCRMGQIEGLVRLSIIDVISKEVTSVKSQR